jgi:hypothetical protein
MLMPVSQQPRNWREGPEPDASVAPPPPPPPPLRQEPEGPGFGDLAQWLAAGAGLAVTASFLLPCRFVWMLCALPHEMGHATLGCLFGRPSTPAISLNGEAWTGQREFMPLLAVAIAVALGATAYGLWRKHHVAWIACAIAAVLQPICAFTGLGEVLVIAGGHLGELLFAGYCFRHVLVGGKTGGVPERVAFAMAGALVQFTNLRLCFGLLTSNVARDVYENNGSLGMKNDYLRLCEEVFHCRVQSVAMVMLLIALVPLPLGLWLGWRRR